MYLAPLNNGVIFKKLFQDPEILTTFVQDLIGIQLNPDDILVELEKKFANPVGNIDIAIDIFVEDPQHRLVIEIQKERYDYHYDRFLYYHQSATIEQARSYRNYRLDQTVYTIVWLTARSIKPLFQHSLITTSLCSKAEDGTALDIYPHQLFFLNPFYINSQTPHGVLDWLQLVAESIANPRNPNINFHRTIFHKACQLIEDDGLTPQERVQVIEENEYENHLQLRYNQGIQKQAQETARKMLNKGLSIEDIIELTGLSEEDVAALAAENT